MASVEQFMSDYFRDRTATKKLQIEANKAVRNRFYKGTATFDSRRGVTEKSETEKIISVSASDSETRVITTGHYIGRSRYLLKPFGDGWLIDDIETECGFCHFFRPKPCDYCGGKGWRNHKETIAFLESDQKNNPPVDLPSEEPAGRYFDSSAIETFMAEYFQETMISIKKQLEIQEEHAKRFFSSNYDWTIFSPSVREEKILSITPVDSEIRVITTGLPTMRLRYHLHPAEQSWLIGKTDIECGICRRRGRKANCVFCGGTIWNHKKLNETRPPQNPPDQEPPATNSRWQP